MAKKQKSFAEKATGKGGTDTVWVKYVKSIKSNETGKYRFNEQMVGLQGGETLDAAIKRLDEASNLVDIDLSEFIAQQKEEVAIEETPVEEVPAEDSKTEEANAEAVIEEQTSEKEATEETPSEDVQEKVAVVEEAEASSDATEDTKKA
ncbi:MAG: DUF4295 family protein [Candidatus Marinimicrobia bacterium]|jgi:hypothetical protein|nr:DUF4295 family protein [Candidatus Neomarinimicrobiota bacterium]MBT3496820.1 DUF4295 family protein [Candidatus Neomarinimicrobiota bacterium]MBT3692670.1 DUF4295 family protein [Candidatus Neomarinimicrobiota bacterium]MBT3732342.1 DUF4295 family protein [Candidatus Neomarinimicrobiota bacterium]MBT4144299.1 DUF4295 family protein [Candidatus Neomarinimicrobiota bacterium]